MDKDSREISWAARLNPSLIRKLYKSDAAGIQNDELIDEVGYGLYARADSFVVPFAKKFMEDWVSARDSYADKMRAIDYLIHSFHYELEQTPARPAAINFIEGNLRDIVKLIFELAYSDNNDVYNYEMERWINNAKKCSWLWKDYGAKELYEGILRE